MKVSKLSLITAVILSNIGANAADSLAEALVNGKLNGSVQATYATVEQDRHSNGGKIGDGSMFSTQLDINYLTDTFYGFRFGLGLRGSYAINPDHKSRSTYNREWYADGFALSEIYLGYEFSKTDIKAGRQYVNLPLVQGNWTRAFNESFEGITITSNEIPDTTLIGGWYDRFQGCSKNAMNAISIADKTARSTDSGAPKFKKRIVVGGWGPVTYEFDNAYTLVAQNQSIKGLKLTASWGQIQNVKNHSNAPQATTGDINFYLAEANYKYDIDVAKLGLDVLYKGSRASGGIDDGNDGNLYAGRVGIHDFSGFTFTYAYQRVSKNDDTLLSIGDGAGSYAILPIRGPFAYSGYRGMRLHKIETNYNFSKIGVNGLFAELQYVKGDSDTAILPGVTNGNGFKVDGWSAIVNYDIPALKGLYATLIYASLDRKGKDTGIKEDYDELWLQFGYRFNLLK